MSKASIKDVAKEAGVSISSVSFYMNRPERLSQACKDRIAAACKKLDYNPGKKRRGPKLGRRSRFKTRNICFYCMFPWTMEELFRYPSIPKFFGCMQEELHKHHCRLIISGTGDNCQIPVTLSKKNCDGVILFGKTNNVDFYRTFKEKIMDLPVVWSGAVSNDDTNEFDHVFFSNQKIAEMAAKYAVRKKYNKVAVFNTHPEHLDHYERIVFFEEQLKKYDIEIIKFEVSSDHNDKSPAEINRELFNVYEKANIKDLDIGYFCSDYMMLKFYFEMLERTGKKPEFELFGCQADHYALDFFTETPATINIRIEDIAKQTVRRLLTRIDNYRKPMAPVETFIEPQLLEAGKKF